MINSNHYHCGRFGNLFFTGMALHFIAKTNDLQCRYKEYNSFVQLGFTFYSGTKVYNETIPLSDENFFSLLEIPSCVVMQNVLHVLQLNSKWFIGLFTK